MCSILDDLGTNDRTRQADEGDDDLVDDDDDDDLQTTTVSQRPVCLVYATTIGTCSYGDSLINFSISPPASINSPGVSLPSSSASSSSAAAACVAWKLHNQRWPGYYSLDNSRHKGRDTTAEPAHTHTQPQTLNRLRASHYRFPGC